MKCTVNKKARFATVIHILSRENTRDLQDFEGEKGEVAVRYGNADTAIYASVGDDQDILAVQDTVAVAVRKAVSLKRTEVSVDMGSIQNLLLSDAEVQDALYYSVIGAVLGAYQFTRYKSEPAPEIGEIEFFGPDLSPEQARRAGIIAEATTYARDLINGNAGDVTPQYLADEALKLGKISSRCKVTVLDEKEIVKRGLNLIHAVGKGSPTPPRLIVMEYEGADKEAGKTAVLGKGVTFDSGGQNLKPSGSIENMRLDMGGAAATLGVMQALCRLEAPVNVVGLIPTVHNAIGRDSYFTGDVYTSYSGKTVEVLNTDAEGRLILADALSYCKRNYAPHEMIDMATLTGAVVIALGDTVSGLFSNDTMLSARLFKAGESSGDRIWELPLREEHRTALKSDRADLRNTSKYKRNASSLTAAAFLESFVEDTPWAHLDIAGSAWNDREARGTTPRNGTGAGVRCILDYLLNG
ncbi:MAG: leucyl aminopeptidase family protein [Fibrobacterota bacterium]